MSGRITWPDGKDFAFSIFDDPDSQTLDTGKEAYSLLSDLDIRITKGVWPVRGPREPSDHGTTCADPAYRAWAQALQKQGFEIGLHNATSHTSNREETIQGLERFREYFQHDPKTMAFHYYCDENLHWGDQRVSGIYRTLYNALTLGRNRNKFHGHIPGHPEFWGDVCKQRIKYVRNFVFGDINTLKACPYMPYHDPARPDVNYWYASSEGANVRSFVRCLAEPNQDRLEEEGGASIMYTHFAHGYTDGGALNPRFRELMERLRSRNGWFVPVGTLLDFLQSQTGHRELSNRQRARLERRWLAQKIRFGTA